MEAAVAEEALRIIVREVGVEAEVIACRINNHNGEYPIQLRLEEEAKGIQQ